MFFLQCFVLTCRTTTEGISLHFQTLFYKMASPDKITVAVRYDFFL